MNLISFTGFDTI